MFYHKIINGEEVVTPSTSLYVNGHWVSNPPAELFEQEGWLPLLPPEPQPFVPEPQSEPYTSDILDAIRRMFADQVADLPDKDALAVAALFPTWHSLIGQQVAAGERIWDDGKLWKVLQPHTVSAEWRPAEAVSLYVEVSIAEWPEIPENIPSTAPWMKGDKGTWKGQHYICDLDNCVWNPDVAPQYWQLVA